MFKIIFKSFLFLIFINFGCATKESSDNQNTKISTTAHSLYIEAKNALDNSKFEDSKVIFQKVIEIFPLTNEAIQSQIMLGFIDYLSLNYENAISSFNKIIQKYPSHKNIDYVYYMRAVAYFEQIEKENLDGNNNFQAIKNFNEVINKFPDSEYTKDSRQKIIYVRENIAAKHMDIAYFYLDTEKYFAAMGRYQEVINNYSKSKFTAEALFRLVEIYYKLGMIEDAKKTAAVISYNYPKSKWYKYSYKLINEEKSVNKSKIISKLTNLIKKN